MADVNLLDVPVHKLTDEIVRRGYEVTIAVAGDRQERIIRLNSGIDEILADFCVKIRDFVTRNS